MCPLYAKQQRRQAKQQRRQLAGTNEPIRSPITCRSHQPKVVSSHISYFVLQKSKERELHE